MYSRSEFDEVYLPVSVILRIRNKIKNDYSLTLDWYNNLKEYGFDIDNEDSVDLYISTFIDNDIVSCYISLGYPKDYDKDVCELYDLLKYASVSDDYFTYDTYKDYCVSPIYESVRGYQPSLFEHSKNFVLKFPHYLPFYKRLKDINSSDLDSYKNALQVIALHLSANKKYVTEEGNLWLKQLLEFPDTLIHLPIDSYLIKSNEQIACSITSQYYEYLDKVSDELIEFLNNDLNTSSFTNFFYTHQFFSLVVENNEYIETYKKVFVIQDICDVFQHLGHSINIDTLEGKFLFLLLLKLGNNTCNFETFNNWCNPLNNENTAFEVRVRAIDLLKKYYTFDDVLEQQGFRLEFILNQVDHRLKKKYMVILYRISSAIAKADGIITDEESQWLSTLVSQEGINEEDEKVNDSNSTTTSSCNNPIEELESLIGLSTVKKDVVSLANFIKMKQMREAKGLKAPNISYHCVFTGNPGTGKTTVARILASIFKELGILKRGHLVETDRSGLVAEYVGQTAVKTNQIIDSALDGVLFVDEAYTLVGGQNDYGKEAIATLLKRMEDDRNRLIVILAGYSNEMEEFINSNPGLRSRFNRYIYFPDYSASELFDIFQLNVTNNEYKLTNEAKDFLRAKLSDVVSHKAKDFGNARYVRNYFEMSIEHQANRLAFEADLDAEKISELNLEDVKIDVGQRIEGLNNIGF